MGCCKIQGSSSIGYYAYHILKESLVLQQPVEKHIPCSKEESVASAGNTELSISIFSVTFSSSVKPC